MGCMAAAPRCPVVSIRVTSSHCVAPSRPLPPGGARSCFPESPQCPEPQPPSLETLTSEDEHPDPTQPTVRTPRRSPRHGNAQLPTRTVRERREVRAKATQVAEESDVSPPTFGWPNAELKPASRPSDPGNPPCVRQEEAVTGTRVYLHWRVLRRRSQGFRSSGNGAAAAPSPGRAPRHGPTPG